MKRKWFIKAAAVSCAAGLAVAVMSQNVFARVASAAAENSPPAPEGTLVVLEDSDPTVAPTAEGERDGISLLVDGQEAGQCVLIGDQPYMGVKDFFSALGQSIQSIDYGSSLSVAMTGLMITAQQGQKYFVCNERYLPVEKEVQCVQGTIALPLQSLVMCVGLTASWDREQRQIAIDGGPLQPLEEGSLYYDSTDLYWLSRLISAVAADRSFEAKVAVGNVCVNRLGKEAFDCPQTIYDVVFGKNQFDMVTNGMIYSQPEESAVLAAKLALEGWDLSQGAVYVSDQPMGSGCRKVATWDGLQFFAGT